MSATVFGLGPLGIFLLMVPESACIPVPSELTLMSAGFGVHQHWFSFPAAVAAATAGNLAGSLVAYWLGRQGALAKLPERWAGGLARCEELFVRRGDRTVFVARLLPFARSFVSLPAGHFGVSLWRFLFLTIAGCAVWSSAFVLAGSLTGSGWQMLARTIGRMSLAAVMLAGGLVLVRRRAVRRMD